MHSRKKKHLEERINAVKNCIIFAEGADFYDKSASERYNIINFAKVFGNNNPVMLEIGCGKGAFVCKMATEHRELNFVAVERISNVLISACEAATTLGLSNLKFLNCSADNLMYVIPPHSISRIYLNFSCPLPKNTYANRRLTHSRFLNIYKNIMLPHAEIHQKTDSQQLFEFSIEMLTNNGYALKNISLDLHNSDFKNNIMTEYEEKFVASGARIYRLEAFIL